MRLCSRERVVLDGVFPSKDEVLENQGGGSAGEVFTIQTGLTFPMEFIDFGACYYRKFFFEKGQYCLIVCLSSCVFSLTEMTWAYCVVDTDHYHV